MACCTRYCAAETQFSKKVADRDLRRYRRRGATGITKLLLAELKLWPLQNKELLDVGSGIGVIGAALAAKGLASATLVEASPFYLEVARQEVELCYAPRPTQFLLGDFAQLAGMLPDADVVTLDRVICCCPDAKTLLNAAAARTRELLAFTYPRDRWYMRAVIGVQNVLRRVRGNKFRVFVHPPQQMCATLESNGLIRAARRETLAWVLDIYRRR
jgi:2-polyprenyl-3-methyl-5-hydroxy-6-metoxy-1,4-benzoquinol methylase